LTFYKMTAQLFIVFCELAYPNPYYTFSTSIRHSVAQYIAHLFGNPSDVVLLNSTSFILIN
jgi:hypothetical protein